MECRKAEQLMQPFVDGTLDISKMREFVEHVEICQNCYEDLEIHVLVQEGFARLES
ncbi:zf-HC2 domain-containing protein, partial [bacterium 1XD42-8]